MINMATKLVKTPTKGVFKVVGKTGTTWKVDRQVKGQRITKTFASCEAAKAYLRITREQLIDGVVADIRKTFDEVAQEYLQDCKRRLRNNSYIQARNTYNRYIKKFFPPQMKIKDINNRSIKKYQQWVESITTLSQGTKCNVVGATLKRIFKYALDMEYIRYNPAVVFNIRNGYARHRVDVYTEEERRELEEFTRVNMVRNYKTYLGFMFSIHAGLRIGEIVALQWCDIDFSDTKYPYGLIKVTKQYDERSHQITQTKTEDSCAEVPMNKYLKEALLKVKEMVKPDNEINYILQGEDKSLPMCTSSLRRNMFNVGKKFGIKVYPHKGRHTVAQRLIEYGIGEEQVSRVLRHATGRSVTMKHYVGSDYKVSNGTVEAMNKIYSNITTIHVVKNTGIEKETKIEIAK